MAQGEIILLGTGTSSGVPVVGCRCPVCTSTDSRNVRSRCSALLSVAGDNILIDTATDLRQQALRHGIEHIDAVLYTHTHADHIHGIDDLRPFNQPSRAPIPLYGSAASMSVIRQNFGYIFDEELEPGYRPRLALHAVDGPFTLFGLAVIPIRLRHGRGEALGYRIGSFAYLTDCSAIPEESFALLDGLDTLVIDALRFRPHVTHFNIAQALSAAGRIGARRTLLTHLSHEVDHGSHAGGLPAGVEFAYDGETFPFSVARAAAND
ncbi:MAG TPA: MBL fold metallo-hydrolase [Desulfuromonas sp.]|nr:MBL fold metallo-hydrolase [Desulfuromonas sp.]